MKSSSLLWKSNFLKNKLRFNFFSKTNSSFTTLTPSSQGGVSTPPPRKHGGLKDSDRIFTNVYRDGDPFIEGALKRVQIT